MKTQLLRLQAVDPHSGTNHSFSSVQITSQQKQEDLSPVTAGSQGQGLRTKLITPARGWGEGGRLIQKKLILLLLFYIFLIFHS